VWNVLALPRRTSKARIPDGMRIYAVGDVHGRADLLEPLLVRIDADLAAHPISQQVQVFLGDYIDRGPNSREVLDLLIKRRRQREMICLMGNHETFAAEFIGNPSVWQAWKAGGGVSTLLSYGVAASLDSDPQQLSIAFGQALPADHSRFLANLPLSYTCGDFFFCHAGVRPKIPLQQQRPSDLLWIRDDFILHEEHFGKVIVHGHTPTTEPDIRPNRINIDTGAYATGRLTCLVLEGDQIRFI
jgi:diadenosine tetraphosphatase ApaH/serine/threonine PP2A family protein phosphatase